MSDVLSFLEGDECGDAVEVVVGMVVGAGMVRK